jgi:hypothetical protein
MSCRQSNWQGKYYNLPRGWFAVIVFVRDADVSDGNCFSVSFITDVCFLLPVTISKTNEETTL